jgi:hypothetical protein
MTSGQRRQVWSWAFAVAFVTAFIAFDEYIYENASWLRWVASAGLIAAIAMSESAPSREIQRERVDRVIAAAPWLKVWFVVCAIVSFVGSILLLRSGVDLAALFGFKVLVIAFVVLLGPFIIVRERLRYRELANAI